MTTNPNPDPTAVSVVPPATNQTAPVCKFEEGCHRVVACEPGCGVAVALPAPVDRAAVLRWAADDLATAFGDPTAKHIGALGASHLRRRARQIEAEQAGEDQPETPLEKRLRYSERRNDELRAESLRRGKVNLEYAEKIVALERQIDEVRSQLGAEILRAGQAEAELRCLAAEERDEQQAQANLDQLADDLAAAIASCPGYEMSPNPCRCPCEGCKHHCGAHDPQPAVAPRLAAEAPHAETPDAPWHRTGGFDQHDDYRTTAPAVVAQPGKETDRG